MKRIKLNVDIEDNEILDKTLKEALISQAKQIARGELEKELQAEIERITTAKINEVKGSGYYNSIASRITDLIVKRLEKEIIVNTTDINEMIEDKVNIYLDSKIEQKNGLDGFIQKYIDQSIASALMQRVKEK